jgi:hypothetical protein
MNGQDSLSDPVARRIRYTESYPSARGSARLGSARRESDDVAGGSHYVDVSDDWTLTWHANCACLRHDYVMMTSSLSGSGTWVRSSGIRVGSAYPGEEAACDAWCPSVRGGSHLAGAWRRVRTVPTSDFDAVFTSGFVSSSSTQWYGQNTILTTFIFEQKSNTTLNHQLWYQLLGIPSPLCADRWCFDSCSKEAKHTGIQYLTWFGKTAYIHGRESILLEIREMIQYKYTEEEDHFTQTLLLALFAALAATAIAALHFLSCSLHFSPLSS